MTEWTNRNPWIATAIIVIVLLLAAFIGYRLAAGAPKVAAARYEIPQRFQQELIELDKRTLNEVYVSHADKLWGNYVSQVSNFGHATERIDTGLDHLHQAWVIAMEAIEKREQKLKDSK